MLFITKKKRKEKGQKEKKRKKPTKKKIFKYLFQQASIFIRFLKFRYKHYKYIKKNYLP
jgi:hypothetical protein